MLHVFCIVFKKREGKPYVLRNSAKITIVVLMISLIAVSAIIFYIITSSESPNIPESIKKDYSNAATYSISNKDLYLEKLKNLSTQYEDIDFIINKIDYFPDKILDLLLSNPETLDFVLGYPNEYHVNENYSSINIKDDYVKGSIPHFLQWDKRWGYRSYGDNIIALNGCGPTALSMVIVGLTGDIKQNPKEIADFSYENGYYVEGTGTSWTLISEGAKNFGIIPKELSLSENVIISALESGNPIIVSMRKGHFTTTSHYIVLTGVTESGKITVLDPNSIQRSAAEWDIDIFMQEARNLWSFTRE